MTLPLLQRGKENATCWHPQHFAIPYLRQRKLGELRVLGRAAGLERAEEPVAPVGVRDQGRA